MKFEDLTKDELIYCIRRRSLLDANELDFDVLMYRQEKNQKKQNEYDQRADAALSKYIEIAKKYEGKPICDVPDSDINSMSHAVSEYEKYSIMSNKCQKEWERFEKKIDGLLKESEAT